MVVRFFLVLRVRTLCAGAAIAVLGCASDDGEAAGPAGPTELPPGTPTYHGEVAELVAENCARCHTEGGIAPFPLDSYLALDAYAEAALEAIESGKMPPWMPDPDCRDYQDARLLLPEQKEMFRAWVEAGRPEGEPPPDSAPVPKSATAEEDPFVPTHVAAVPGYTPDAERPDDYRCFVLELDLDREYYLTDSQVVPGAKALVHHALVYAMPPGQLAGIEAADAADPGPGYTCFGDPTGGNTDDISDFGANFPTQIGSWIPGIAPMRLTDGVAIRIEKGSRIVIQVHYNTNSAEPEPDATELQITLTEQTPAYLLETRPAPILDLSIPAGEADSRHTLKFVNYRDRPVTVASVTGHMHLLGQQFRADVIRGDGAKECMLDIPDWDFGWQQSYIFLPGEQVEVAPGDAVEVTCSYDNTAENQAIVNGQRREPRRVAWGEGTFDEMCLLYMSMIEPFEPTVEESDLACRETDRCQESCDGDPLRCAFDCGDFKLGCLRCVVDSVIECGLAQCATQLIGARSCLEHCGTTTFIWEGGPGRCMQAECPAEYERLTECLAPLVSGECKTHLAACGIGEAG